MALSSPAFASQLSAIMEVLARAAVAEITQLVEAGGAALRREVNRRDEEIQELRRSLEVAEEELCRARREAEELRRPPESDANQETPYPDPHGESGHKPDGSAAVKHEPAEDLVLEAGQQDDPVWPSANVRMFSPHLETADVPIKVEVEIHPVSVGLPTMVATQRAGPSVAPPPALPLRTAWGPNQRAKKLAWKSNPKLFVCTACNRGFPRMSQLEEHRASHQLLKPFRCLECGKSFTQKTRLKTHQSVHTGERPFSCKICGKMFSRQDNCTRHERFHSGLRPYSCGTCGKSFTVLGNLKIHQEIHQQGR